MLRVWRNNWYWIGGVIFVALSFFMGFWGVKHLEHLQVIMVFSWMAMLVHQVEEYGWPGGFPGFTNILALKETREYDRYPFNPDLCFFDNVFTCYTAYIIPIFFPDLKWLAIAQICNGSLQVLAHVICEPIITKRLYNPGGASALFLQLPLAVYTMWYLSTNHLAAASDYVIGWIGAFLFLIIVFLIPVALLRRKNSKYKFTERQIFGYLSSAENDMRTIINQAK